jgi:flagellar capping protein FliD
MGITINGPSGIDTATLIDQLVALEQDKVTTVQTKKTNYQVQIDGYSKLKSYLSDLGTKATALNSLTAFDIFKSSSSDEKLVTVKGGVGAIASSYDLSVYHLAKSEKMISKAGQITSQTAALSTFGIATGDISIAGTTINISSTDTIQDLRSKINNATDSSGKKLGVTASVLKMSGTDYRLVLSAKETGATGIEYKDLGGASTLKDLGIITTVGGDKGNTNQTIVSQNDFKTVFDGLAAGATVEYSGIDHDGNKVTNTFVKTAAGTSVDDFLAQVKATYHNMVDATIDGATGQLVISDKVTGSSQLALGTLSAGGAAQTMAVTQSGKEGAGVLSAGSDAYFNLDGLYMNSASNNPDSIVAGVTIQFHKASVTETTTVSLDRDVDGIKTKVQDIVDAYNALLKYANDSTKLADPNATDKTSTAAKGGDLPGDMTVKTMVDQVRNTLKSQFSLFGGTMTSLTMAGVKTDAKTGEMSIDDTMFEKAVSTNFDEFTRMFVTTGVADNKTVAFGRSTSTTQSGNYILRETESLHLQIQLSGSTTWYTSDVRNGDIVTFSNGPASGLSVTSPVGVLSGADTNFTFSRGLGDKIQGLVDSMTNSSSGTIATHQESLRSMIKGTEDRITRMQTSVNDYHTRLQKQFAAMEQALSTMKAQYAKMASALGLTTTSG